MSPKRSPNTPSTFTLTSTLPLLRAQSKSPWDLGHSIGLLIYHISPLVSTHLDNPLSFSNPVPSQLTGYAAFVSAISAHLTSLRHADKLPHALPTKDRKDRSRRKKQIDKYTHLISNAYKACICDKLGDVFIGKFSTEDTRLFNMGVDKPLSGVQWVEYPGFQNVVIAAGTGDWAEWLKGRCERLGKERVGRGRGVLQEM